MRPNGAVQRKGSPLGASPRVPQGLDENNEDLRVSRCLMDERSQSLKKRERTNLACNVGKDANKNMVMLHGQQGLSLNLE